MENYDLFKLAVKDGDTFPILMPCLFCSDTVDLDDSDLDSFSSDNSSYVQYEVRNAWRHNHYIVCTKLCIK